MKTTKKQIVEWGMLNIDECGYGVDAAEMHNRCWRCGYERPTERCHVIPASLGGSDTPSNYRLLCHDCHLEAPNVADPDAMDKWIRDTCHSTYDDFWKEKDKQFSLIKKYSEQAIMHWGEKNFNSSTKKWIAEKAAEEYADTFAEMRQG